MPGSVDAGDRRLLIGAGVVLVILLVVSALVSPPQAQPTMGIPSSYSPAWDGAKAAFLLLKDIGYQVERWERPPTEISDAAENAVLILAEPRELASAEERQAIQRFLSVGGRILVTGALASRFVPEATPRSGELLDREWRHYRPLLPSPLARSAPEIAMAAASNWEAKSSAQLVVYGEGGQSAVVTYRFGKGRVIWWAAPTPLTNGGIREKDNLVLLLNSLGPPGQTRVLWDEYYHGARDSLWSYLARTPVPWAAVQLGLLFLAALVTFSRRRGPVRAPVAESRLSPLEFVETLGDLYHTAHAGPAAVGIAYQRFRFLLTRQLGLPANAAVPDLSRSASRRLGWNKLALLDTLGRAERAMRSIDLREAEALELVQQLHDYAAHLARRRSGAQETHG